jgi:pilus assembly protein CpaE
MRHGKDEMTETLNIPARSPIASARKNEPTARVFVPDQHSEGVIRQSLGALRLKNTQFISGNVDTAVAAFKKERSPQLLIVDITGVHDPVASMRRLAEVCEPDVNVVAVGDLNDIILYRNLKNTGISEYFMKPLVRDLLVRTCQNILTPQADQSGRQTGKLVFMLGVRGGVGATTVATNTAWHLAEIRHRHTLVLDLDTRNGDAALQLDADTNTVLRDAFEQPERVDKLYLERGAMHLTERLDLLASLESLTAPTVRTEDSVLSLLEKVLVRYRFAIIDLPSIIASDMPQLLPMSSICVLISNTSLAAARDVARWRERLGDDTASRSTLHILNHTAAHGGLAEAEFIKGCGKAPDIIIPYDREVATASVYGIKAVQKCAIFNRGLTKMVDHLTGEQTEKSDTILSRIFG